MLPRKNAAGQAGVGQRRDRGSRGYFKGDGGGVLEESQVSCVKCQVAGAKGQGSDGRVSVRRSGGEGQWSFAKTYGSFSNEKLSCSFPSGKELEFPGDTRFRQVSP